jgi:hypothetical protein
MNGSHSANHNSFVTDLPFTKKITEADLLYKFKLLHMDRYDGSQDLANYLGTYRAHMALQASIEVILYRAFPLTLKGAAKCWFSSLQPQSIGTFFELGKNFLSHFIGNRWQCKLEAYLLTIK